MPILPNHSLYINIQNQFGVPPQHGSSRHVHFVAANQKCFSWVPKRS